MLDEVLMGAKFRTELLFDEGSANCSEVGL